MIKYSHISLAFAASLAVFCACKPDIMEVPLTDKGPQITVLSSDNEALMGDEIAFSVDLQDSYPLSTLKAELLFDESSVSSVTIRTKENGTYEGVVDVPFIKDIPDGTATLQFTALNTAMGKSVESVDVKVSRPDFEYLTLKVDGGESLKMEKSEKFSYSVSGNFEADVNATIETSAFGKSGKKLCFAWVDGEIGLGDIEQTNENIPFSNGVAGEYTISFNTLTYAASPFISLEINGTTAKMVDKNNYAATLLLKQGDQIAITGYAQGFEGWYIDVDFLESVSDGVFKLIPVDGYYKINIGIGNQSITVERMNDFDNLGTLNLDGTGTVWMIGGSCYGKPVISNKSWDPEGCGLPLAEVSPRIHQITFEAGSQISASSIDVKFFGQKSWGVDFGGGTISTDSDMITAGESDGNIHLADGVKLDMGGVYRFTLDLTGAAYSNGKISGAVVHFAKIGQNEVEAEKIAVNGVEAEMVSASEYIATLDLQKGQALSVSGIDDILSYYFDPDFLSLGAAGASWNAMSGKYSVAINISGKYFVFKRLKADGSEATIDDHALYMMGWGTAHPIMDSGQFGWGEGKGYSLAEVEDYVYQLTGIAVEEHDAETIGGRFRYDYVSCKYFAQNAYGKEKGKIRGEGASVEFTDRAAELLKGDDNLELKNGNLEKGATYVLRIDLSTVGKEVIDFYKK